MNIKQIQTSNAVCAFLPRSLAPISGWYQGSALPTGGAFVPTTGEKRRMAIDPRTHSTRTLMI